MAPFLPIRALNRSSAVRINKQVILPGVTSFIDLGAAGVPKELAYHSAIGQVYPVGPLTNTAGTGLIFRNSLVTTPATIAAVETVVLTLPVAANVLAVGSVVDIEARGTLSAAASGTINGIVRMGTAGTTADTQVCATGLTGGAVTTAVGWAFDAQLEVRVLGNLAAGLVLGNSRLTLAATVLGHSTQAAAVAVDTTVAETIDLSFVGGGTTPVVTVLNANIQVTQ